MASSSSSSSPTVVDIHDEKVQQDYINASKAHDTLLVLFFWAEFNEASKPGAQLDQLFSNLASRHPDVQFAKVRTKDGLACQNGVPHTCQNA